ncbi:MAG: FxDxF family PEP-CTERM protein [Pseudomonadota bacterium]
MKSTSLVLGALLAGAACASPYAAAQAIERSVPIAEIDDGAGGFNAHFGDGFTALESGSTFTDLFTFDVSGLPFDAAASVTSSYLNSPFEKDLRITALSLYRYDPATMAIIGPTIAGIDQTGFGDNPTDSWALSAFSLPVGAYAVRVDGVVVGSGGGSFGADLTVSPVPEAPGFALLLAGLAAGALVKRSSLPGKRTAPA